MCEVAFDLEGVYLGLFGGSGGGVRPCEALREVCCWGTVGLCCRRARLSCVALVLVESFSGVLCPGGMAGGGWLGGGGCWGDLVTLDDSGRETCLDSGLPGGVVLSGERLVCRLCWFSSFLLVEFRMFWFSTFVSDSTVFAFCA